MKALGSGDPELVYSVLLRLKERLRVADLFRLISRHSFARKYFELYCKRFDKDLLRDFYYQDDCVYERGLLVLADAFSSDERSSKMSKVRNALSLLEDCRGHSLEAKVLALAGVIESCISHLVGDGWVFTPLSSPGRARGGPE